MRLCLRVSISSIRTSSFLYKRGTDACSLELIFYSMMSEWVFVATSTVYDVNIGHSLKLNTNLNHYKYMFCWLVDFNEQESDRCFGILFAARETSSCTIDKKCTKMVTQPNLKSYPLTHQILFSIEAEKDVSYVTVLWFLRFFNFPARRCMCGI